jgi:hypothetical protein
MCLLHQARPAGKPLENMAVKFMTNVLKVACGYLMQNIAAHMLFATAGDNKNNFAMCAKMTSESFFL